MRIMRFMKMEGAGNDFVVTTGPDIPETAEEIRMLCDRKRGIGADGLLILYPLKQDQIRMEYFNSDGSVAGMCGNGLRCSMEFAAVSGLVSEHASFQTGAGLLEAWRLEPGLIRTRMPLPEPFKKLTVCGRECFLTSTGVPHAVIPLKTEQELDSLNVNELGRAIRFSEQFAPEGANVDFIAFSEPDTIRIRTYERGVEAETLACGTGMAAAGAYAYAFCGGRNIKQMRPVGGDHLSVELSGPSSNCSALFLTGPAKIVFTGIYEFQNISKKTGVQL